MKKNAIFLFLMSFLFLNRALAANLGDIAEKMEHEMLGLVNLTSYVFYMVGCTLILSAFSEFLKVNADEVVYEKEEGLDSNNDSEQYQIKELGSDKIIATYKNESESTGDVLITNHTITSPIIKVFLAAFLFFIPNAVRILMG